MHWKPYCSRTCQYQAKLLGKILHCGNSNCENTFYRQRTEIHKVHKSYCSRSCAVSVNNRNTPKRIRSLKYCANKSCDKNIPIKLTYCSRSCFNAVRTTHRPSELIEKLQMVARKLGRAATKREFGPTAYMCIRAFASWTNALLVAGLTPHRSHSERMYNRKKTIALDGHQCDSISEAIIDNWLTENRISHLRNTPYPKTGHRADWSIATTIFIEYFGLAHDSPRYDRSIQEKRRLCDQSGIQLVEVYAKDLYPIMKLDAKLGKLRAVV